MPCILAPVAEYAASITVTFVEKGYKPTFEGNYKSRVKGGQR
jgi:hypothetical protein